MRLRPPPPVRRAAVPRSRDASTFLRPNLPPRSANLRYPLGLMTSLFHRQGGRSGSNSRSIILALLEEGRTGMQSRRKTVNDGRIFWLTFRGLYTTCDALMNNKSTKCPSFRQPGGEEETRYSSGTKTCPICQSPVSAEGFASVTGWTYCHGWLPTPPADRDQSLQTR